MLVLWSAPTPTMGGTMRGVRLISLGLRSVRCRVGSATRLGLLWLLLILFGHTSPSLAAEFQARVSFGEGFGVPTFTRYEDVTAVSPSSITTKSFEDSSTEPTGDSGTTDASASATVRFD